MSNPSLLERVEAATGADRALDRDLWEALTGECTHRRTHYVELENDERELECSDCGRDTYGADKWSGLTRSLDAALSLVERVMPGWHVCFRTDSARGAYAHITSPEWEDAYSKHRLSDERHGEAFAPTLALALLAALLKATEEKPQP